MSFRSPVLPKRNAPGSWLHQLQTVLRDPNLPIYFFLATTVAAVLVMVYIALTL